MGRVYQIGLIFTIGLMGMTACSEEPAVNQHNTLAPGYVWHLNNHQGISSLEIYQDGADDPIASYDISDCYFCEGEGDNCEVDGIRPYSHPSSDGPLITVTCHIGAHSQRFALYAPLENSTDPIAQIAGYYSVRPDITPDGIRVEADGATFDTPIRVLNWPHK